MSWEWLLGLLPFLVFLACPIGMWFMMRGMSADHCRTQGESDNKAPELALQREVEALRARVAELESGSVAARARPDGALAGRRSLDVKPFGLPDS